MTDAKKPFRTVPRVPSHARRAPQPGDIIPVADDRMTPGDMLTIGILFLCLSPWFVGVYHVAMWIRGMM